MIIAMNLKCLRWLNKIDRTNPVRRTKNNEYVDNNSHANDDNDNANEKEQS